VRGCRNDTFLGDRDYHVAPHFAMILLKESLKLGLKEKGEIQKGRPALVVSDEKLERRYKDIILAAITSHIPEGR